MHIYLSLYCEVHGFNFLMIFLSRYIHVLGLLETSSNQSSKHTIFTMPVNNRVIILPVQRTSKGVLCLGVRDLL